MCFIKSLKVNISRVITAVCVISVLPVAGAGLENATELNWYAASMKGVLEVEEGGCKGALCDMHRLVHEKLPGYDVKFHEYPVKRMLAKMHSGEELCETLTVHSPARDRFGYFIPFFVAEPISLVVRADNIKKLSIVDGRVEFSELALKGSMRGVVSSIRTYPSELSDYMEIASMEHIDSGSIGQNILMMVSHDRYQYTLEYSFVVDQYSKIVQPPRELIALPIREVGDVAAVGFYCAKGEWGRRMRIVLDRAIKDVLVDPEEMLSIYRKWVGEKSYRAIEPALLDYIERRKSMTLEF